MEILLPKLKAAGDRWDLVALTDPRGLDEPIDPALAAEIVSKSGASKSPDAGDGSSAAVASTLAERSVQSMCESFVASFLQQSDDVCRLYEQLKLCDVNLIGMEAMLRQVGQRISDVKSEIGELRVRASSVAKQLCNARAVQSISTDVIAGLTVPPDALQILLSLTSELGAQFSHSLRRLHGVLAFRQRIKVCSEGTRCNTPSVADPLFTTSSAANIVASHAFVGTAPLIQKLSILVCERIKDYLMQKIEVLNIPRTNIAIQQHNVLREYRHLVAFLQEVPELLGDPCEQGADGMRPAAAAKMMYDAVRRRYIQILSTAYLNKLKTYIKKCNALEVPHRTGFGGTPTASTSFFPTSLFSFGLSTFAPQATLASTAPSVTQQDFALGSRGALFSNLRAMPIVPHVAESQHLEHTYEETFRSFNILLSDIVTSEFLFSFEFFRGDLDVHVEIFKPTIQFIIDYVAEVVLKLARQTASVGSGDLTNATPRQWFESLKATCSNTDFCGLLILIRMTHLFRVEMSSSRKICTLCSYYDSLLMLLWPAFNQAFDLQLSAVKGLKADNMLQFLNVFRTPLEKVRAIHPISRRYAALSATLMSLGRRIRPPQEAGSFSGEEAAVSVEETPKNYERLTDDEQSKNSNFITMLRVINDADYMESEERFRALESKLTFMRWEYMRVIDGLAKSLLPIFPANRLPLITSAPAVNNFYFVVSVWSSIPELDDVPSAGPFDLRSPSPMDMSYTDDDALTSVEGSPYESASASARLRFMAGIEDYRELRSALEASRTVFAEEALQIYFRALVLYVNTQREGGEAQNAQQLESVATSLVATWQVGLEQLVSAVQQFIVDTDNQRETLKVCCTQLLLYNSRLHAKIAETFGASAGPAKVRALIITNQQLLHRMRTSFAEIQGSSP